MEFNFYPAPNQESLFPARVQAKAKHERSPSPDRRPGSLARSLAETMVREASKPIGKYTDTQSNSSPDAPDPSPDIEIDATLFIHDDGEPLKAFFSLNLPTRSTFKKMFEVLPQRGLTLGSRWKSHFWRVRC
jgi:hypothetical protein